MLNSRNPQDQGGKISSVKRVPIHFKCWTDAIWRNVTPSEVEGSVKIDSSAPLCFARNDKH